MKNFLQSKAVQIILKTLLSGAVLYGSVFVGFIAYIYFSSMHFWTVLCYLSMLVLPSLILPLIWLKKRKLFLMIWSLCIVVLAIVFGINYGINRYEESITINVTPNINTDEYLPFEETSKIVQLDSQTLKLTDNLPVVDGATALFPVYSAFVNAVYPSDTELYDGVFQYTNTNGGYQLLAERHIDVFFGVYPSEEQIAYANECGTTFSYTPIGQEAFVFFVHKDNPIDSLTSDQIRAIYAGEITNWSEVGGRDEAIVAFQRNEGSGSQSRLIQFMGDKPLMDAPSELVDDFMVGIIKKVADYKSKTSSIGFSFRYYVEGVIQNPDIKLLAVDDVAPTVENIQNGSYPLIGSLYAVTYEGNENENVDKLIDWVLSEEGQYIIEQTGYVGVTE